MEIIITNLLSSHTSFTISFLLLLLLLLLLSTLLLLLRSTTTATSSRRRLPPGPTKLPFIGNLHQLVTTTTNPLLHHTLHHLSTKHGPLMHLQLGSIPTLIISSPQLTKQIFKSHDLTFSSRPPMYAAKTLGYNHSDIAFAPYGEYWREIRKIAVSELLSVKRVQSFESVRKEEVCDLLDAVTRSSTFDLSKGMLAVANNLICRIAFGRKWGGEDDDGDDGGERIDEVMKETQALLGEVNVADFYSWIGRVVNKFNGFDKRLGDNFKKIDKFFDRVIAEHRDRSREDDGIDHDGDEDIIDVLLRIQSDPNQVIRVTDTQIKGVLADIFIAGTDTMAATVVWTMSELIRNPPILAKVQAELTSFIIKESDLRNQLQISESDLPNNFPYLKMIIKESLRLHPPVPLLVPRETISSCDIGEYHIRAKTRVFVNQWAMSRNPEYWGGDVERFVPERFCDGVVDFRGQDYGFIPFGVGRRICPGMNFANVMVELVLANLLCGFEWRGVGGEEIDMEEAVGLTCHKKTALVLAARPRYVT